MKKVFAVEAPYIYFTLPQTQVHHNHVSITF